MKTFHACIHNATVRGGRGRVEIFYTQCIFPETYFFFFFFTYIYDRALCVNTDYIFFFLLYLDEIASGNQKNPGIQ